MKRCIFLVLPVIFLVACQTNPIENKQISDVPVMSELLIGDSTEDISQLSEDKELSAEALLDEFVAGNIPAFYPDAENSSFYITELLMDEMDYFSYSVGEKIDLDNDGESELILEGPYGGIYLDARGDKIYVLDEGTATTEFLSYTTFDGQTWIVHSDTIHEGRCMYWFTKYDGTGKVLDTFLLSQEFWETPDMPDGPDAVYTYRDEVITEEEYNFLKEKMLHTDTP